MSAGLWSYDPDQIFMQKTSNKWHLPRTTYYTN